MDRVANRLFGEDFYASSHPGPADVLLLAEVAESSRSYDLGVKVPLYAQAGIPEVWVLDLEAEKLLVFREPSPQGYKLRRLCTGEDRIAPLAFRELAVTATEIFPRKTTSVR